MDDFSSLSSNSLPTKRVTLNDVAQRAGVSYQTVSRVIHEHPYVAETTRQVVLAAIKELGYRPNLAARSLVTRRSLTLGIVSYGYTYYGPGQMLAQIERAARASGYHLTYANVEDSTSDHMRRAVHTLCDRQVDGLLIITPLRSAFDVNLVGWCAPAPVVLIDAPDSVASSVSIDQHLGSRLATEHLIALGHTQIASISGPLNWFDGAAREASWRATLADAGLVPGPLAVGDWSPASGFVAAQKLLASSQPFTGLVVGNDQMALGALRALHAAGRRVPDDISVVGFDDIPEAAFFEPPLTTVRQDFDELGQRSVQLLIRCIEEPDMPLQPVVLPPSLIVRHSTRTL